MAKLVGVDSVRLDRYYSGQMYVKLMEENFGDVMVYLIPKKNATVKGSWRWKRMLHKFVNDTKGYLHANSIPTYVSTLFYILIEISLKVGSLRIWG